MLLLELLFPSRCPVCDRVLGIGEKICPDCFHKLKRVQSPYCKKCGKPLEEEGREYCADCAGNPHLYKEGRALYEYRSVKKSIYRFKYKGRYEYAEFYGKEMAKYLEPVIRRWKPDALVPVPLHFARKKMRGYNQAEALAKIIGAQLGIPVNTRLIKRIKNTVPQKKLDSRMRQNNLKKAFKIDRNDVKLSTIIVVDDIYTTGSTIDALAEVLQKSGIKNIYFIALAVGKE